MTTLASPKHALCGALLLVAAQPVLAQAGHMPASHHPPASGVSDAAAADAGMSERRAVEAVLKQYKDAIESLDAGGTEALFTPDAQIYETGGSEGTYANYLAHHLGPELKEFRSFTFSDYKVDVRFEGPVAVATETYRYRIELEAGEAIERQGVATSVLKKVDGSWKIVIMHNSSRRPRSS